MNCFLCYVGWSAVLTGRSMATTWRSMNFKAEVSTLEGYQRLKSTKGRINFIPFCHKNKNNISVVRRSWAYSACLCYSHFFSSDIGRFFTMMISLSEKQLVNKPLSAAGISEDNAQSWETEKRGFEGNCEILTTIFLPRALSSAILVSRKGVYLFL